MSRARSVSQLVGANTALGNTVITGTANVSSTLGTNGSITVTTTGIPELKVRSTSTTGSRGANVTLQVDSTGGDDPAGAINFFTGSGQVGSIQATSGGSGVSGQLYINLANTGNTVRQVMKIDTEGRMTLPYLPAFHAHGYAGNQSGNNVIIAFSTTSYNNGNCYSTSTNRFTAPISGTYCFSATFMNGGLALTSRWGLQKNGTTYADELYGMNNTYYRSNGTWIVSMSTNDYVTIVAGLPGTPCDIHSNYRHFSGYLLG